MWSAGVSHAFAILVTTASMSPGWRCDIRVFSASQMESGLVACQGASADTQKCSVRQTSDARASPSRSFRMRLCRGCAIEG